MFSARKSIMAQLDRGGGQMVEKPNKVRVRIVQKPFWPPSKEGRRVLIYLPSGEVIASYSDVESKLSSHGWERCCDDPDLQFRKRSTVDLVICLPKDFGNFTSIHMDDIVLKNPNVFEVREM